MLEAFDRDDAASLDYILMEKPSMLDKLQKYSQINDALSSFEDAYSDNLDMAIGGGSDSNVGLIEIEPAPMPSDDFLEIYKRVSQSLKDQKTSSNNVATIKIPKGLNKDTIAFFKAFSEYAARLGYPVRIAPEGGFRTAELQHKIYKRNRPWKFVTGKDGYKKKSVHQFGAALDIISKKGYGYPKINAKIAQLLRKFATENQKKWSFRFIAKDPNHIEINREKYGLGRGDGIQKNGYIEYYGKRKKKRRKLSRR